jgi:hypothetical protein
MVSMSRAKQFRKESELLQMLEDSTDSELSSGSLFHSDENNTDSDSENLGDNPEIVDDVKQELGGLILINWKNMKTLQAPIINYLMEAPRKIFSIYMSVGIFVNL